MALRCVGGVLVGLAARQEHDARHRRRHVTTSGSAAWPRRLPRPRPGRGQSLPATTMFGFSRCLPARRSGRPVGEQRPQHLRGDLVARRCRGRRPSALPARRSARGPPPGTARRSAPGRGHWRGCRCPTECPLVDVDHRPPLGETRAQLPVFVQPLAQAVQPLGDLSPGRRASGWVPLSTLMPGMMPSARQQLGEGNAVAGGLAEGLVEQDRAAEMYSTPSAVNSISR